MRQFTTKKSNIKAASVLLLALITIGFCSCGKAETPSAKELGGINDVEVSETITVGKESYAPFSSYENNLGYEYKWVNIPALGVKLQIPKTWDADFINARMLKLSAPENDGFLPLSTINIVYNYVFLDPETLPITYDPFFDDDLPFLGYQIDGDIYYEQFQDINARTDVFGDDSITDDSSLYSVIVRNNAFVTNKSYRATPQNEVTSIHANLNWRDTPVSIRSVVKEEQQSDMEELLLTILSSFTEEWIDPDIKTIKYKNISLDLPVEFEQNTTDKNIYEVSSASGSTYAGMKIGFFDVKDIEEDPIEFARGTAYKLTCKLFNSSGVNVICSAPDGPYSVPVGNKNIDWRLWDLSYTRLNEPFTTEDVYFGKTGVAYAIMYALSENQALVIFSSAGQFERAIELEEYIIRNSISF